MVLWVGWACIGDKYAMLALCVPCDEKQLNKKDAVYTWDEIQGFMIMKIKQFMFGNQECL